MIALHKKLQAPAIKEMLGSHLGTRYSMLEPTIPSAPNQGAFGPFFLAVPEIRNPNF